MGNMKVTYGRPIAMAFVLAGLLGFGGCGDNRVAGTTGVGNPPQSVVAFSMVADQVPVQIAQAQTAGGVALAKATADPVFTITDRGGTAFTLTTALVNVGLVKFKLPDGIACSHELEQACEADELKIEGAYLANLMNGSFTPAFPSFQAPHGAYRRVIIRLEALKHDAQVPDTSLRNHSLLLAGTFAYGGRVDRSFTITLAFNEVIQYDSGSVEVREQAINRVLLRLNVDHWFSQADITRCLDQGDLVLDEGGNLRIDKDNACEGLEELLKDGIEASGNLEEEKEED